MDGMDKENIVNFISSQTSDIDVPEKNHHQIPLNNVEIINDITQINGKQVNSLYKIFDLVSENQVTSLISKEKEESELLSIITGKKCFITHVKYTGNESEQRKFNLNTYEVILSSEIACQCWDINGDFLVVGDDSGKLAFICDQGSVLLSYPLIKQSSGQSTCIDAISFTSTKELIVLARNGKLMAFSNVPSVNSLRKLSVLNSNDLQHVLAQIKFDVIDLGYSQAKRTIHVPSRQGNYYISGSSDGAVSCFAECNRSELKRGIIPHNCVQSQIKTIRSSADGKLLLTIAQDGLLQCWDAIDLVLIHEQAKVKVIDAVFLNCTEEEKVEPQIAMLILDDESQVMKIYNVKPSHLVEIQSSIVEGVTHLAATTRSRCVYCIKQSGIDSIIIQLYGESEPHQRVRDLLTSGCFEEAEQMQIDYGEEAMLFSPQFQLSFLLQTITVAVDKSSSELPSCLTRSPSGDIRVTMTYIHKIQTLITKSFETHETIGDIINTCLQAVFPSFEDLSTMIHYIHSSLVDYCRNTPCNTIARKYFDMVSDVYWRFGTFQLISEPCASFNPKRWQHFRSVSLEQEMGKYLSFGSIRAAKIIWTRHAQEGLGKHLSFLLNHLPNDVPPKAYSEWLQKDVIPVLEQEQLLDLGKWLYQRVHSLADKGYFDGALSLTTTFLSGKYGWNKLNDPDNLGKSFGRLTKETDTSKPSDIISKIGLIHSQLKELSYLEKQHGFSVSLTSYCESNPSSIFMAMLDRIESPEMLKEEMKHASEYLDLCGVEVEQVLVEYILEICEDLQSKETHEEYRAIAIIQSISDLEKKSFSALSLLRSVHSPYSKEIYAFADEALGWGSCRCEELQEQKKLMYLQEMLLRYGLKQFNLSDSVQARRLLHHIVSQTSNQNALTDAMHLVSVYSDLRRDRAVVSYIENLITSFDLSPSSNITSECTDRVMETLKTLENDLLLSVIEEIIVFCLRLLEEDFLDESISDKEKKYLAYLAQQILDYVADKHGKDHVSFNLENLRNDVKRVCQLQNDCNTYVSLNEIQSSDNCEKVIQDRAKDWITSLKKSIVPSDPVDIYKGKGKKPLGKNSSSSLCQKYHGKPSISVVPKVKKSECSPLPELRTLGRYLGISALEFEGIIAHLASKENMFDEVTKICYAIASGSMTSEKSNLLIKIISSSSIQVAKVVQENERVDSKNIMCFLNHMWILLGKCLVWSTDDELSKVTDLFHDSDTFKQFQFQTSSSHEIESLHDMEWKLYREFYRGDSIVLPIMPALKHIASFVAEEYQRRKTNHDNFSKSKSLVAFLIENDSNLLALSMLSSSQILPSEGIPIVQKQLSILAGRTLQAPVIDHHLALGYLLSSEQQHAFDVFRKQLSRENLYKDFSRLQKLAIIGIDAARAWEQIAFLHHCTELEGNARWWHYFTLLGIECDQKAFTSERKDMEYIRKLVPKLLRQSNLDFYTVLDFCQHYNIEDSYASIVYVEELLLNNSNPLDMGYQDMIIGVISDIHQNELIALLLKVVHKIQSDDYERLTFVFKLLIEANYQGKDDVIRYHDVIEILKSFCRKDKKNSSSSKSITTKLPEGRLPFHDLVKDPWKVLESNLSTDNIARMVALSTPLQLDPDDMYMHLIRTIVKQNRDIGSIQTTTTTNNNNNNNNVNEIMLHSKKKMKVEEKSFRVAPLNTFSDLIKKIHDLENAITTAEWIADQYSLSQEKIDALQLAFTLAQEYEMNMAQEVKSPDSSFTGAEAITRLKKKICRCNIELILLKLGKDTSCLLQFIDRPQELFLQLYRQFASWVIEGDIAKPFLLHKIADEISSFFGLGSIKLRKLLVQEWLNDQASPHINLISQNNTILQRCVFEPDEAEIRQQIDEKNTQKIVYMCEYPRMKGIDIKQQNIIIEETANFLLSYAQQSKTSIPFRSRCRALYAVVQIASSEIISKCYPSGQEAFEKYLRCCEYMIEFEEMRIPMTTRQFIGSDKEGLARALFRDYGTNERVLRLISLILLDDDISNDQIWEVLITRMNSFHMHRYVLSLLNKLSKRPLARSLLGIRSIWKQMIFYPFSLLQSNDQTSTSNSISSSIVNDKNTMISLTGKRRNEEDVIQKDKIKEKIVEEKRICGMDEEKVLYIMNQVLCLLETCPFIEDIDIPSIVLKLKDLHPNLHPLAVRCVFCIPNPTLRGQVFVRMISCGFYLPLLDSIMTATSINEKSLHHEYEDGDILLVQSIYEAINTSKKYSLILGTKYEASFKEYLIETESIDGCLQVMFSQLEYDSAIELIQQFYATHPDKNIEQLNGFQLVKFHLQQSSSLDSNLIVVPFDI